MLHSRVRRAMGSTGVGGGWSVSLVAVVIGLGRPLAWVEAGDARRAKNSTVVSEGMWMCMAVSNSSTSERKTEEMQGFHSIPKY